MNKIFLSVDWDYFFAYNPMWDWAHQENVLHHQIVWNHRLLHQEEAVTTGEEIGFWQWLKTQYAVELDTPIYVSDSHLFAYEVLNGDNVWLVDAHHDNWEIRNNDQVTCENWLTYWLRENASRHVYWTARTEHRERCQIPATTYAYTYGDPPEDFVVTGIHICRSGCWVPPWLDERFVAFCHDAGETFSERLQNIDSSWIGTPLKPRWDNFQYEGAKEFHRQMEILKGEIKNES